ncbi:hypothetical protein Tco_0687383 [Tanacetum coccineum]
MANLSEDIQCAGSDTRPPMLDRMYFDHWQQNVFECIVGVLKNSGEQPDSQLMKGLFRWEHLGILLLKEMRCLHLGPERACVIADLSPENKGIRTYGDNVKIILEVKLNRGLRDSNYDQLYAYLKQHEAHANENKMITSSNPRNQATVQDDRVVVQNVQGRHNRGQGNNARGAGMAGYGGALNRVGNANPGQARQMLLMQAQENGVALDEKQLLFLAGGQDNTVDEDVDEQLVQDLALGGKVLFEN